MTAVLAQEPSEPAGKLCQITERPFEPVVVTVLGRIKPAAFQMDCARFSLTPMKFGTMQLTTGLGVAVGSGVGVGIGVGVGVGVGVAEGVGAGVEVGVGVAVGVGVGVGLGLPPGTKGCGYVYAV